MFSCALVGCLALATLNAQSPPQGSASQDDPDADTTMFPHSQTARYWISGQDNIISSIIRRFPQNIVEPTAFGQCQSTLPPTLPACTPVTN
jgi:hypothetical protein